MSLGITTATPEGIVLASDSRQSYRNKKVMGRIGSDSAKKIFRLGKQAGLIVAGLSFLPGKGGPRSISRLIAEFRNQTDIESLSIAGVSNELHAFFEQRYQYKDQLENLPNQIKADLEQQGCTVVEIKKEQWSVRFRFKDPAGIEKSGIASVDKMQFIVAGFNNDGGHQVCMVYVPGNVQVNRDSARQGHEYGASWIGQTDVVSRIILGFEGRVLNLPIIQKASKESGADEVQKQLRSLEYVIQWGILTLQDGIDFSTLAIETTTAIQRFSDGIAADPGDVPGVGGPVDVAVIAPGKGFVWVAKKNLRYGGREVDLEALPNLNPGRE